MPGLLADTRRLAATGAQWVAGALFIVMFGAFGLQVFFRYVLNAPLGWTLEVCLMAYVWIVFWGAAFLTRLDDHVSFDLFYMAAPAALRRVMALLAGTCLLAAMLAALPASFDFVTFMKIDSTPITGLRFDVLFSVYLLFAVALSLRLLRRIARLLGRDWREVVAPSEGI